MDRIKFERAIDGLTEWRKHVQANSDIDRDISTAIESLKAQLFREDTTSDTISRQAAIEKFAMTAPQMSVIRIYEAVDILDSLPTIQPVATDTNVGDTISRQAAIDALDKQIKQCCKALGSLCLSDVDKHAVEVEMASLRAYGEMLENLPTIQPEPKWIPVSERLPETEEFVLVSMLGTWRHTIMERACEIADYADGEWCVYAYPHMSAEKCAELIEAWMPLPEPYKEGGAK